VEGAGKGRKRGKQGREGKGEGKEVGTPCVSLIFRTAYKVPYLCWGH